MISEDEFVAYMRQDFPQLKMTREDLANPSKQFAINFYWNMLEMVTRMNPKLLVRTNEQQDRLLQGATAAGLSEHIAVINLFKFLKYIFAQMQFQTEFRFSDLIVPFQAPKRSFVFMASLYQFYTHCAVFDEKFEAVDRTDEKQQLMSRLQQEQAVLKEKLALKEERKKQFQTRSADIKKQLGELSEANDQIELTLKELEQEKAVQMEKVLAVEKQEQLLQADFERANNEKKYHESLVVSDASDIIEHHGNLSRKKDASFRELRDLEQQVTEKNAKEKQVETVLGLYNSLVEALRAEISFDGKSLDLKDLSVGKSSAKKAIQVLEKEKCEIAEHVASKQEEKSRLSDKFSGITSEYDRKYSVHSENVNRLNATIVDLQQQLSQFEHKAQIEDAGYRDMALTFKQVSDRILQIAEEIKESDANHMQKYEEWKARLLKICREIEEKALPYQAKNPGKF